MSQLFSLQTKVPLFLTRLLINNASLGSGCGSSTGKVLGLKTKNVENEFTDVFTFW